LAKIPYSTVFYTTAPFFFFFFFFFFFSSSSSSSSSYGATTQLGPGLFNPPPPGNLLHFLHLNILLASLSTASSHHPLCLPTGLLSSVYPIMLKVRTHISTRELASRRVNISLLNFICNYLRLHANMTEHKIHLRVT
jgi:hypothetical protein